MARRLRGWLVLPTSVLARMRVLCLGLALVSVVGNVPILVTGPQNSAWRIPALVAAVVVAAIWIAGYRRGRFWLVLEPVEAACIAVLTYTTPDEYVLAPLFAVLFRSLYGTAAMAFVRFLLYAVVMLVAAGPDGELLLGRIIGLAVAAAGMFFMKISLRRQERGEEAFRLLEGARDYAVFMLGRDGHVRSWNTGAERMLGFRAPEIIGQPLARTYPPESRARDETARDLAQAAAEGSIWTEGRRQRADGSLLFAEVVLTALKDERGRAAGFSVITRDVSERRAAEVALEQSKERLRAAVGGAPMVLWSVDRDGIVTLVEGGRLQALGLDPKRLVGRNIDDLGRLHPQLLTDNRRALSGERIFSTIEHEGATFETSYSHLRGEDGDIAGIIGVATDVTARQIADRLQRSLLPSALPEIPHVEMARRYVSGAAGSDVGGDWYDVIPLPDGKVGLVVGDVVGRGVEAASLMGQLRIALFVTAVEVESPAEVLEGLNGLMSIFAPGKIATALYGVYEPTEQTFRFATAGHLAPLIVGADGAATFAETPGSLPLGALSLTTYSTQTARLAGGATLVLYTDGLVERPGTALSARLACLRDTAIAAPADLERFCDHVLLTLTADGAAHDDVAMLAFRPRPVSREHFELELPANVDALATARDQLRIWLTALDARPIEIHRIAVACGEACANAVEHAYPPETGTISIRGRARERVVEIEVEDRGSWRPPRGDDRGRGLTLIRGLLDDARIIHQERGTRVVLRHALASDEPSCDPA